MYERDTPELINICYINFNIKQGKAGGGVKKSGREDKNSSNWSILIIP